ncbi:hypothetical protein PS3A_16390 [Pseudomonas sp. 3A(2025)]
MLPLTPICPVPLPSLRINSTSSLDTPPLLIDTVTLPVLKLALSVSVTVALALASSNTPALPSV